MRHEDQVRRCHSTHAIAHAAPIVVCAILLSVLPSGCGLFEREEKEPAPRPVIEVSKNDAGVAFSLTVMKDDIAFGAPLTITAEAVADPSVSLEWTDYAEALSDHPYEYRVAQDERKPPQRRDDGKLLYRRNCRVEFFLPGEYELPTPGVIVPAAEEGGEPTTLAGEPFTVIVRDPAEGDLTSADLKDLPLPNPVDLPAERTSLARFWWVSVAGLGAALAAALVLVFLLRGGRHVKRARPIPAHVWANERLAALRTEQLVEHGRVQEFYYRLSDVVRGYIERRFRLLAPEMTTEEFLEVMTRDSQLSESHRSYLQAFLTASDLAKYALHQPDRSESDEALEKAETFVRQTCELEETSESTSTAEEVAA